MAIFDTATPITYIISDKVYPLLEAKEKALIVFTFSIFVHKV
jgi:hypothetical protein